MKQFLNIKGSCMLTVWSPPHCLWQPVELDFIFIFFIFHSVFLIFFFLTKGISPQINTLYRLFKNHTSNPLIYNSAAICPGRELAGMMH